MEDSTVYTCPIPDSEIGNLPPVHRAAFRGFFLSKLGPAFLRAYYRQVSEYEKGILIGAWNRGYLVGFAVGFLDSGEFYSRMYQKKARYLIPAALGILRRPALLTQLLRNARSVRRFEGCEDSASTAELSALAVIPEIKSKGIGSRLLSEFISAAKEKGARLVSLSTDRDGNDDVLAFYRGHGLQEASNSSRTPLSSRIVLVKEIDTPS